MAGGRPRLPAEHRTRPCTVAVPLRELTLWRDTAEQRGVSISALVKAAMTDYLDRNQRPTTAA